MRSLLAVLLLALPLHAQVRETVEVNVLELDVAVVDREGNPVEGLTKNDFEVRIGGKAKDVSNFFAVRRGSIVDAPDETSAPGATIAQTTDANMSIPTTVVLFVDDLHLGVRSKMRVIEALEEYVRANVGGSTSAMIARFNGALTVRTRPTDRPGPLLAELDKMALEPGLLNDSERRLMLREITETFNGLRDPGRSSRVEATLHQMVLYSDQEMRTVQDTLEGLREMINIAASFDGRKSLLYVSEGLPLMAGAEVWNFWEKGTREGGTAGEATLMESARRTRQIYVTPMRYDLSRYYERVIREAQSAKVTFYTIDTAGVRGLAGRGVEEFGGAITTLDSTLMTTNQQDGLRYVSRETGGRFISNENDLGNALAVLSEQFATYYSLGVRAPASTRLLKVDVRVKNRPDLRVLTARHRKPLSRYERIERAVRARLYKTQPENPLGAKVALGTATPIGSQCVVPLRLSVKPREHADIYFALLDERQQESGVRTERVGDSHAMSIGVKPGKYVLSIAVDDAASDQTAYFQQDIDARNCR